MPTEDTPDRRPEKSLTDHHFETPIVQEDLPAPAANAACNPSETTPGSAEERRRASRPAKP